MRNVAASKLTSLDGLAAELQSLKRSALTKACPPRKIAPRSLNLLLHPFAKAADPASPMQ
jgi:hypothetical protein